MENKKLNVNQVINMGMIIVSIIVAANLYKKQYNERLAITQKIEEQEEKNRILGNIEVLIKKITAYKESYKPRDRREIITTITRLASQHKIKVNSLKPIESSGSDYNISTDIYYKFFCKILLTVDDYHQLGRFINSLEQEKLFLFIIETISVNLSGSGSDIKIVIKPGEIQVDLTLSAVFLK